MKYLDELSVDEFSGSVLVARGDEVLFVLGQHLQRLLRASDVGGRYGGEEFMVMLTHVNAEGGVVLAERWRTELEETPIDLDDGRSIRTTLSIGVASYMPIFKDCGELVAAADGALYRAKHSGRNQVAVYQPWPEKNFLATAAGSPTRSSGGRPPSHASGSRFR